MFTKINIKRILREVLYFPLRKSVFNLSWINYMTDLIRSEYNTLLEIRKKNLFLSNHTIQKISFEHLLNNIIMDNGNRLVTGNPIYCETTGNMPLHYMFLENDLNIPNNVFGYYIFKNQNIEYQPLKTYAYLDSECYDSNGTIIKTDNIAWMFLEQDKVSTNEYTIYVDSVDFIGLVGYDINGNAIYQNGSKLDIIDKYAKQYTCVGINYKIKKQ